MKQLLLIAFMLIGMIGNAQLNTFVANNSVSPPISEFSIPNPSGSGRLQTGYMQGKLKFVMGWDKIIIPALQPHDSTVLFINENGVLTASDIKVNRISPAGGNTRVPWDSVTNKPMFSTVAFTGSYNDLINKPTIPSDQVNSDWNASSGLAQILNKPTLPKMFASSGTTTSGLVTFNLATTGFTSLTIANCKFHVNDDDGVYSYEVTAISSTSVTVSVKKQFFSGVTIGIINVLGTVGMNAVTNGTTVYCQVIGN